VSTHLAIESVIRGLPGRWRVESFRRVAEERGVRNAQLAEQPLSLSSTGALYERTEATDRQFASEQSSRNAWLVMPGDLVVNPMWLFGGAIGVSHRRGAVSPDYRVYRLSPSLEPRFVHHLLRSSPYRDQYRLYMRAETTFDRRITKDDFAEMPVVIPPVDAQRAIADFLDSATERIDGLIAAHQRLLELCAERAAASIEALLDGNPVPVKRLVTKIGSGKTPSGGAETYVDEGIALIRSMNVRNGQIDLAELAKISEGQDALMQSTRIRPGDVLLNITGGSIGRSAVVPPDLGPANVNQHVCILRPGSAVSPQLLSAALMTAAVQSQIAAAQVGGNREGLTFEQVGNLVVRWPDARRIHARVEAIRVIQEWTARLRRASTAQADTLRERRIAMVSAAVTGRLHTTRVAA
jgi:type I restriction enzyme S subunit